jgi:3-methyladenine DNA glycosylase AlkD
MNLIKSQWNQDDQLEFMNYLRLFQRKEKETWTRNILNTKLELLCLPSKIIGQIAKEIQKGNYQSYLDLEIFVNYETIAIYGVLLTKIDDFEVMTYYLDKYANVMENWAHVDILSFNINESNKKQFILLSQKYQNNSRTFARRLGLMILFQMVKDEKTLPFIFDAIIKLKNETEYYVIMMAGWLLSECIILHQDATLNFLTTHHQLNRKVVNKGIQKCRESRRFSKEQKDFLLQFKR